MRLALITDTHWGARNDNNSFAEYFNMFYDNQFFPYLKEHNINTIVHLGDICDRRKYINFVTAGHLRRFVDKCAANNIVLHVIIGNHDCTFKNTNDVNCMNELFHHSKHNKKNLFYYSGPESVVFDNTEIAFLPWICSGNYNESMKFLESTKAQVLFGHLEIAGFEMYRGSVNDHGFGTEIFQKFDAVMSGHFHHKSSRGNIHYLGAPYEITWSDWNDPRGFHIFDTETRELTFIQNRYKMFHKIHYDDSLNDMDTVLDLNYEELRGSYVKVIIHNKNNPYWFDMYISKLEKCGVLDLQVVEDNLNLNLEDDSDIVDEAEDTLTILRKFSSNIESKIDKNKLDKFLTDLYAEALTVE